MRASRQTELTARFPLHVVCEWIGNSAPIADKHYLQVTDSHYADAAAAFTTDQGGAECGALVAQNQAQRVRSGIRGDSQSKGEAAQKARELPSKMPLIAITGESSPIGAFRTPIPPTGVEPVLPD